MKSAPQINRVPRRRFAKLTQMIDQHAGALAWAIVERGSFVRKAGRYRSVTGHEFGQSDSDGFNRDREALKGDFVRGASEVMGATRKR